MLNAAIVGLGWWGRVLVEAVQHRSHAIRFTRGVTLEPELVHDFARQYELCIGTQLDDVLADASIEAVVLATPHSLHVDQIVQVARAGKAVFCEKPLAFKGADARRALQAVDAADVVLGLGHDKRWLPAVCALAELVTSGDIGEVLHVEGQYSNDFSSQGLTGAWRQSRAETPAGGLSGPGLHVLDALLAIAGPAVRVAGLMHDKSQGAIPADAVALLMRLESGATATVTSVRGVPDVFRLAVFGTGGWAEVCAMDRLQVAMKGRPLIRREFATAECVRLALEAFAAAVRGRTAFPISRADMMQTVCTMEAAAAAIECGRWVEVRSQTE